MRKRGLFLPIPFSLTSSCPCAWYLRDVLLSILCSCTRGINLNYYLLALGQQQHREHRLALSRLEFTAAVPGGPDVHLKFGCGLETTLLGRDHPAWHSRAMLYGGSRTTRSDQSQSRQCRMMPVFQFHPVQKCCRAVAATTIVCCSRRSKPLLKKK